jgi:hypothetical protein
MSQQVSADVASLYLERLNPALMKVFETDHPLLSIVKRRPADEVSDRNYRIQIHISPGGQGRYMDVDGGVYGTGSASKYVEALVNPIHLTFGVQYTSKVEYATDKPSKAVRNAVRFEVDFSMEMFQNFVDKLLNAGSDGHLATLNGDPGAGPTVTVNEPSQGTALLYEQQGIEFWDPTLTTKRAGGPYHVSAITDSLNFKVSETIDAGVLTGDLVMPEGFATSGTNVPLRSIKYHQSTAVTGTWLGLNRATYAPKLTTPNTDFGNATPTPALIWRAENQLRFALGVDALKTAKLTVYINPRTKAGWDEYTQGLVQILQKPEGGGKADGAIVERSTSIDRIQVVESLFQDYNRIDWLDLSKWGRIEMYPLRFKKNPQGGYIWTKVDPTTGTPTASQLFYYEWGVQTYTVSPRSGVIATSVKIPTGY